MRKEVERKRVKIGDISHDWGETRGWLVRRRHESVGAHAERLGQEVAALEKFVPYAAAMARGAHFPPILLIRLGSALLLVDGCHTASAAALNGQDTVEAVIMAASTDDEASDLAEGFWASEHDYKMAA